MTTSLPTPEEALRFANDLAEAHARATGGTCKPVLPEAVAEALGNAIAATRAAATETAKEKPRSTDIKTLQNTIIDIGALSETCLNEIRALSIILLEWLKIPDSYSRMPEFADVLNVIWERAETVGDNIQCLAENVGCRFKDIDRDARNDAFVKAIAKA